MNKINDSLASCQTVDSDSSCESNNTKCDMSPKSSEKTVLLIDSAKRVDCCSNCSTTETSLWRRDDQKRLVCNACRLYYKLNGKNRPKGWKKEIRRRKRNQPDQSDLLQSEHFANIRVTSISMPNANHKKMSSIHDLLNPPTKPPVYPPRYRNFYRPAHYYRPLNPYIYHPYHYPNYPVNYHQNWPIFSLNHQF